MTSLNIVPFVSVDNMMKLVLHLGPERVMTEIAAYIEADFRRWESFDKTPRVASHSDVGVIELMPTSECEAMRGVLSKLSQRRKSSSM